MATDYSSWEVYDLLEALELSGRIPDPELIQACLNRGKEMTAGLLDMLLSGTRGYWSTDDPRWYRDAHAGVLLIAARESEALPIFDQILRDPDRRDVVEEWFLEWLPEYGPKIVPQLLALVKDNAVWLGGRTNALQLLGIIGEVYAGERERILPALQALLPPLKEDGTLDVPGTDEISEDMVELWTWTVSALTDLRDTGTKDQVLALFKSGLIDDDQVGDVDDYLEDVEESWEEMPLEHLDVLKFYKTLEAWDVLSDEDLVEALYQSMVESGIDPGEATELKVEMLEMLGQRLDDEEEDIGMAVLDSFMQRMRDAGVPEDKLEEAVEDLLRNLDDFEDIDFENIETKENPESDINRWASSSPRLVMRSADISDENDDYMSLTANELLDRLELADIPPDTTLIQACLQRKEEIVDGLLSMLEKGFSQEEVERLPDDAPQWFREAHAILLLTQMLEDRALPLFEKIIRDPFKIPLLTWFEVSVAHFGPPAVPLLTRILQDKDLRFIQRSTAASLLTRITACFPETEDSILPVLRDQLPTQNQIDLWLDEQEIHDFEVDYNSWIATALADLRDKESQSKIELLLENKLIDEEVFGNVDLYREELLSHGPLPLSEDCGFNIMDAYDRVLEEDVEVDLIEDLFAEGFTDTETDTSRTDSHKDSESES